MNPLLLGPLFELGKGLIDRLFPDPAAAAAAKMKLFEMQQNGELAALAAETDLAKAQIGVNAVEGSNTNLFVAGWRPFVGWTCGAAFAYKFVFAPALIFGLAAIGKPLLLPPIDLNDMMPILVGMLGLGAMRTAEKIKGAA